MTNGTLFESSRNFLRSMKDKTPETMTGRVSRFKVEPGTLDIPTMQLVAAAINRVDGNLDKTRLVEGMMHSLPNKLDAEKVHSGYLELGGGVETFPARTFILMLEGLRDELTQHMSKGNNGSLYFSASWDHPKFEIDYLLRAALPISGEAALAEEDRLQLFYKLDGEFMKHDGTRISGVVPYKDLCDALDYAESQGNYAAFGDLVSSRCDHAIVPAAQVEKLQEAFGLGQQRGLV